MRPHAQKVKNKLKPGYVCGYSNKKREGKRKEGSSEVKRTSAFFSFKISRQS